MPSVAVDSSILYALFDSSDRQHLPAASFLERPDATLVTNVPVVTEVVYLLRYSRAAQQSFLSFAGEAVEIDEHIAPSLPRIVEIMEKYADLPADFADASLVAMCERRDIAHIATLDRDFDVYELGSGEKLRNVFRDGV
jgi:predicted nucleic acid-binding protein